MKTAAQIIDSLGGSASIARDLAWALTTIESWKGSDFIPEWRRQPLLDLAQRRDISLTRGDFPEKRKVAA